MYNLCIFSDTLKIYDKKSTKWVPESTKWVPESTKWVPELTKWVNPNRQNAPRQLYDHHNKKTRKQNKQKKPCSKVQNLQQKFLDWK